jgi:hypothetical protein
MPRRRAADGLTAEEREELRILQALASSPVFERFVGQHFPELLPVPKALRPLYRLIDESRRRPVFCRVSMPPRFGKTTTFKAAVCYRMAFDPADTNMYGASGDGLATDFGIGTRRMSARAGVPLAADRKAVQHFATPHGGGLKSASIFGDLVGRGVTGIAIADDIIRSREAAESKTMRDKAFEALRDNFYTRLNPGTGASLFVCSTRWHEDDPHGRLSRDGWGETWDEVILPAVTAPDGTPTDEITDDCLALCPERGFDLSWARKALARGPYGFWSLYQQQPRPRGGQMFGEPARFNLATFSRDGWRLVMVLDPAATAKTSSDYSAGGVLALRGQGDTLEARPLEHFRVQEPLPRVFERCHAWQKKYGIPLWLEGVGGFAALPGMARAIIPSLQVQTIPAAFMKGGKFERAQPVAVAWNDRGELDPAGGWKRAPRFMVPEGDDWSGYIDEHRDFTGVNDAHDDQVDWTAHAWNIGARAAPAGNATAGLPSTVAWPF